MDNCLILKEKLAERVGFEPTVGVKPTAVFETAAFVHSATSPVLNYIILFQQTLFLR